MTIPPAATPGKPGAPIPGGAPRPGGMPPGVPGGMPGGFAGGMGGGLVAPGAQSLRLPGEHFAAALLFLLLGSLGLVWIAPELAAGLYPSPHVAGVTHLFTLGWLTTTIFGALYQLLPVALRAPVPSVRLGHTSFWTFVPGVLVFATGVATSSVVLHHVGIGLLTVGILLLAGNVAVALPRAIARDVTWWAVALAVLFLLSTLVLGVVLVHNLHTGFLAAHRVTVVAIHLHVALVGWALVMIVGMSHRLLPMFLLAHGADTRWTKRSLALLAAGVPVLAGGLATGGAAVAWAGLALVEGGIACYLVQARRFHRVRVRRRLDAGLRFVASALLWLVLAALLAPAVLAVGARTPRLATAYVLVGLLGGIVLFVVGMFYKIVPFLAWIARFRDRMGREKVPTVSELYSPRVAHVQLGVQLAAVAALAGGIAAGSAAVVRAGAVLHVIAIALFAQQVLRIARGAPR